MNLDTIVMDGVQAYDWVTDVFDNEDVHMNDDLANGAGDVLDA